MEQANVLLKAITTVGFPIVVCIICFWYINKRDVEHKDEVENMRKTVENNTLVVQKLVDRFEREVK